jgi:flavin reductase (DIM6/NTAB) family NADH-FMN oxidoreductase RutF
MRKVWNRPDIAVWSLVTTDSAGEYNMNICTYVTSVSMSPKMMAVAVFKDTKTLANLEQNPNQCVTLQLLGEKHASLVRSLGQTSGFQSSKIAKLQKKNALTKNANILHLTDVLGYIVLCDLQKYDISGDHILYVGKVSTMKNTKDGEVLTTTFLRQRGYIR